MEHTNVPSQTCTLSDSRLLGYIDYGTNEQEDSPPTILYFHGFPGSRLEGAIAATCTRERGVRLVSIDRPGMGLSTFQPHRSFLDWPKDVVELADHLKINKFYVLGVSGGAPYVLSCAYRIPYRLLGAAIVSGIYYTVGLGTEGMLLGPRILMWAAATKWLAGWVAPFLDWGMGNVARDYEHPEKLQTLFMKEMADKHEKDIRCLDDMVLRKVAVDALRESFRQGSNGNALEARLYGSDWGFALEDIDFELQLWHGRLDLNVPVASAEKAANLLRGAKLRVNEQESHLSLPVMHLEEILESILCGHTLDAE